MDYLGFDLDLADLGHRLAALLLFLLFLGDWGQGLLLWVGRRHRGLHFLANLLAINGIRNIGVFLFGRWSLPFLHDIRNVCGVPNFMTMNERNSNKT